MAALAIPPVNNGVFVYSQENTNGPEESDEKMATASQQVTKSSDFDPGSICGQIYLELLDGKKPHQAAEAILQSSPEIAFTLASYRKNQIVQIVQTHINQSEYDDAQISGIMDSVLILYSTSLMNSSYHSVVKTLEAEIEKNLDLVKKRALSSANSTSPNYSGN